MDPRTALAKGATLYADTRDIPGELMATLDADAIEIEMNNDTMYNGLIAFLAIRIKTSE